ncbi:MAG: hypothetical protein Q8Q74_00900, partial [Polaromonas sp.]|nr:hypothetical protein [Polaromonas sp.]
MSMPSTDLLAQPLAASGYSRFVQRIRRRYADELALLPPGAPERAGMQITYDALQARGLDTGAALRVLRQLVMERLVVLDCDIAPTLVASRTALPPEGALRLRPGEAGSAAPAGGEPSRALIAAGVPLAVVTRAMTELAELALDIAICESRKPLDALHGTPQVLDMPGAPAGQRAQLWVIGMGKLGARELNV